MGPGGRGADQSSGASSLCFKSALQNGGLLLNDRQPKPPVALAQIMHTETSGMHRKPASVRKQAVQHRLNLLHRDTQIGLLQMIREAPERRYDKTSVGCDGI